MPIRLSTVAAEPAVTATLTAGLVTAGGVAAFLSAADLPDGWGWMQTVLPAGIFVIYAVVGLVIRPLVTPNAKVKQLQAAALTGSSLPPTTRTNGGTGHNVRKIDPARADVEQAFGAEKDERIVQPKQGGYQGGDVTPPDRPSLT